MILAGLRRILLLTRAKEKMKQHVIKRFRLWLLMPLLIVSFSLSANVKYILLPDQPQDCILDNYKLSTDNLYGIKKSVELFSLTFIDGIAIDRNKLDQHKDLNLILIAVLPDLEGNRDWTEIHLDSIKNDTIPHQYLKRLFGANTYADFDKTYGVKTKYFDEYQIIRKIGTKYFSSKHCLIQFFAIRNRPAIFQNVYGTINIEQEPLKITEMEAIFKKRYPHEEFPAYTIGNTPYDYPTFDYLRDRREYLSKVIKFKNGAMGYQFWTYTDWHTHDHELEVDRGIDRFVYVPGNGIVGGSFDFYFYFYRKKLPIKYSDFLNNVKEEKVMIAPEFKV